MAVENKPGVAPQPGQPNQPATQSAAQQPAQQKPAAQPAGQPRQGEEQGEGLAEVVRTAHRLRIEVPGAPGVDARLDNRQGRFRPQFEEWPAKPQQIDGPDVVHQVEHTRETLNQLTEVEGDVKGMYSIGSHGLSKDEELREGRPVQGPDEG
jgi:hypothetical protein